MNRIVALDVDGVLTDFDAHLAAMRGAGVGPRCSASP